MAWQYAGLNAEELEGRITASHERVLTTTVDNIQRIESTTVNGQAIIKVYLQPNARLDLANAQITAISQTVLRQYPPGTGPPLIINFSASSVPILQLALSGDGLAEQQLFDLGVNFLRPQLVTIRGVAIPFPFGASSGRSWWTSTPACADRAADDGSGGDGFWAWELDERERYGDDAHRYRRGHVCT